MVCLWAVAPTKTSSGESGIGIAVSSKDVLGAPAPANSGAGGSGLRGLPPYFDEEEPGRGLPFSSAGSYATLAGGGLVHSDASLNGVAGLMGDVRSGEMCRVAAGGGIKGV